jgi:hypothetical protein
MTCWGQPCVARAPLTVCVEILSETVQVGAVGKQKQISMVLLESKSKLSWFCWKAKAKEKCFKIWMSGSISQRYRPGLDP